LRSEKKIITKRTREQAISIRRKVDADNLGTLVGNDIKEARILVSETIVVLTPDNGSQENVEGSNLGTPLNLETLLNPFAVLETQSVRVTSHDEYITYLVDHRVNNMDERLVAVEQTVSATQEVTLKPTLAVVLRKHLDNTASLGKVSAVGILLEVLAHPDLLASSVNTTELVRLSLIRTEETEVVLVPSYDILEEDGHVGHASAHDVSGTVDLDRVVSEVGHSQGLPELTTVGNRVGTHSSVALRNDRAEGLNGCARLIEETLRLIASHPVLEDLEMCRVSGRVSDGDLVSTPVTLQVIVVKLARSGPALRASENDHGPQGSLGLARVTTFLLDLSDLVHTVFERRGHGLVHRLNIITLDKVWLPAVTDKEALEFSVRNSSKNSWVVDLVAVKVKNRQDSTINNGVKELVTVPGGSEGASLSLTITDHSKGNQIGVIKDNTKSM
jgi:hypothetical protein